MDNHLNYGKGTLSSTWTVHQTECRYPRSCCWRKMRPSAGHDGMQIAIQSCPNIDFIWTYSLSSWLYQKMDTLAYWEHELIVKDNIPDSSANAYLLNVWQFQTTIVALNIWEDIFGNQSIRFHLCSQPVMPTSWRRCSILSKYIYIKLCFYISL